MFSNIGNIDVTAFLAIKNQKKAKRIIRRGLVAECPSCAKKFLVTENINLQDKGTIKCPECGNSGLNFVNLSEKMICKIMREWIIENVPPCIEVDLRPSFDDGWIIELFPSPSTSDYANKINQIAKTADKNERFFLQLIVGLKRARLITFDTGVEDKFTNKILRILKKRGIEHQERDLSIYVGRFRLNCDGYTIYRKSTRRFEPDRKLNTLADGFWP